MKVTQENNKSEAPAVQLLRHHTLNWQRKKGYKPVRLKPKSKAAYGNDWSKPNYQPPPDDKWQPDDGVGCLTGPKNNGPIDIDLDCKEAIHFAPYFLPKTSAIFGRASKQRSHYLYNVDADEFDKVALLDPKLPNNNTIVEMRGDGGHQTVFPGSLHEGTGELINWAEGPDPEVTTVSPEELIKAVRRVALASLIARYMWGEGSHNQPLLLLTGTFFYMQWTQQEVERFFEALSAWDSDRDKSTLATVRNTYKRAAKGQKIKGANKLREHLQDDALCDRILELAGSPNINLMNEYNDRFACVMVGNQFRIAGIDAAPGDEIPFYSVDNWKLLTATEYAESISGKPVTKGSLWLANPRRRKYDRVDFLPGREDTGNVLNLWTGWPIKPEKGECGAWLELIRGLCGSDELNTWVLNWLANILREPMDKSRTALVLSSQEQGIGKSLGIGYFGKILGVGNGYVPVSDGEKIIGRFNTTVALPAVAFGRSLVRGR
jgi:hypothetical protein